MSTYRAYAMSDRVVLERVTSTETVFSELTLDQADLLLAQFEHAVKGALRAAADFAKIPLNALHGSPAEPSL